MMIRFVLSVCVVVLFCVTAMAVDRPPNFVIIFMDDMGFGDVGVYGAEGYDTPNLDRMAAEGIRFTDYHSGASVCSASRASLLTGCWPQRVGVTGALSPRAETGINPDEILLPEILKEQGYATAIFGKWHLGHHEMFLPTNHGFDEYFGLPYSNDMWPGHPKPEVAAKFPPLPLMEGTKVVRYLDEQSQLTTWYTERAVSFIERHKDQPFFVYIPHAMTHVPLYVSDKFKGSTQRGLYGDVMAEIDWSVGQILETLKKNGLDENTLVMFTSDNGPWLAYGDHGGSSGPLREGKHTAWEGGTRVPAIMRWPGRIPAGQVNDELVSAMDVLPTFAKLAGAEAPKDRLIDGHDIWPILAGQKDARSPWDYYYHFKSGELWGVRSGRWKLFVAHEFHDVIEAGGGGLPGATGNTPVELSLFDLKNDVGEQINVASANPKVVERLMKLIERGRRELGHGKGKDLIAGTKVRKVGELPRK
jgi:arylsulfatase A-like enzyme